MSSHHGHGHTRCPERNRTRLRGPAGQCDLEKAKTPRGQERSVMALGPSLVALGDFVLFCFNALSGKELMS